MRPRVILLTVALIMILAGAFVIPRAFARITGDGDPGSAAPGGPGGGNGRGSQGSFEMAVQPAPPPTLRPANVTLKTDAPFWSWALLDRSTQEIHGSSNLAKTNTTESMIKAWIVSDYLRRAAEKGQTPSPTAMQRLSTAIRDSNDDGAQWAYQQSGGNEVVRRLIRTCKLTDTKLYSGWWSLTQMSARDAARMGACIADGRAAGAKWTEWVLSEMRQVRGGVAAQQAKSGGGRWGIIDGLPAEIASDVAIKNGWTPQGYDGRWHINCLAIADDWVLAVQAQFPFGAWPSGAAVPNGLDKGAQICRSVTEQLLTHPPAPQ